MVRLGEIKKYIHGDYYRNTTIPVPPKFASRSSNGIQDLNRLLESRKGFRGRSRSWAVYILCWLLRTGTQLGEDEIFRQAMELGGKCVEPLTEREVTNAFMNSRKWGKLSNAKIATRLEITKKERSMKLFSSPPPKMQKPSGPSRAEVRHARIQQYVAGRSIVPTVKEVVFELNLMYGIKVCDKTIRRDYAALGIKNPHTPGENIQPYNQEH